MYLPPRPHEYHLIEQDDRNLTKQSFFRLLRPES